MDYFKEIDRMQKEFLKNPRESIIQLIEQENNSIKKFSEQVIFQGKPERAKLFLEFHKEYALLIHKMWRARDIINGGSLKDDTERVLMSQRIKEQTEVIEDYLKTKGTKETNALAMARVYASSLESFWKMLKKVVILVGLSPENKHLNIPELKNKIVKLEDKYKIRLPKIKEVIGSGLRNSVGHENTYFSPPKTVVFLDKKGISQREVARLTTDELYDMLVDINIITLAMVMVENTAVISVLEPFLKLSDKELIEYSKTGIVTPEMEKK